MLKSVFLIVILIFFISVFLKAQPLEPSETNALLNIVVSSIDGKPRAGEILVLTGQKNTKSYQGITDIKGRFSALVPEGDIYDIKYKTFEGDVNYEQINVPAQEGIYTYQFDLKYDPPKTYTLENVFFDTGKSSLRSDSNKALNDLAEVMKLKPALVIEIAGHTDNIGSAPSNLELSLNRANSVKNFLVKKGINAVRVSAKGYGDTQPRATNDTEEGRQKNRRTEVQIISG